MGICRGFNERQAAYVEGEHLIMHAWYCLRVLLLGEGKCVLQWS